MRLVNHIYFLIFIDNNFIKNDQKISIIIYIMFY